MFPLLRARRRSRFAPRRGERDERRGTRRVTREDRAHRAADLAEVIVDLIVSERSEKNTGRRHCAASTSCPAATPSRPAVRVAGLHHDLQAHLEGVRVRRLLGSVAFEDEGDGLRNDVAVVDDAEVDAGLQEVGRRGDGHLGVRELDRVTLVRLAKASVDRSRVMGVCVGSCRGGSSVSTQEVVVVTAPCTVTCVLPGSVLLVLEPVVVECGSNLLATMHVAGLR